MSKERYCMPDPTFAMTDEVIRREVPAGSRVIDLGCGDGRLLNQLRAKLGCQVQGIEIDHQAFIKTLERGISVIQTNLDEGIPSIPDDSFDVAVLSQTLQQVRRPRLVLNEMMRVAKRALVMVPNFAHWRVRLQVVLQGRAPITDSLPYEWYNSPNLHFMSMHDVRDLCKQESIHILKELPIIKGRAVDRAWGANLRAESAFYVLEREDKTGVK